MITFIIINQGEIMNNPESLNINNVSETLLIPLYFRACEEKRANEGKSAILRDSFAQGLIDAIPYDYSKLDSGKLSRVGCCVRAAYFDRKVAEFITKNDHAVVICGGCGLDTRYERLKSQNLPHFENATFYEIDLPEVIALRKSLLSESSKDVYLGASLLEKECFLEIKQKHANAPIIVVIEGVMMYFDNEEITKIFSHLSILGEVQLWVDFVGSAFVKHKVQHDTIRHFDAKFRSGFDNPDEVIALAQKANVALSLLEISLYMRQYWSRWGIFGMLMGLLPRKIQMKFSFMAGFEIRLCRDSG
ncbi:class I SAM-dependent methyltransferase [Helicobacter sp. MIT 05-5293]|nr:class I SAM-dependent methyltransferase [Helicobacter sp. MIT 05-5293]